MHNWIIRKDMFFANFYSVNSVTYVELMIQEWIQLICSSPFFYHDSKANMSNTLYKTWTNVYNTFYWVFIFQMSSFTLIDQLNDCLYSWWLTKHPLCIASVECTIYFINWFSCDSFSCAYILELNEGFTSYKLRDITKPTHFEDLWPSKQSNSTPFWKFIVPDI